MSLLTGLFRDNGDAHEVIEEPPLAQAVDEPAPPSGEIELRSAVARLAEGMVEAWSAAVRNMQKILASDHARMEAAAAELHRVTEELTEIRQRLDTQAGVLRDLHSATEAQAARTRHIAAAVTKCFED